MNTKGVLEGLFEFIALYPMLSGAIIVILFILLFGLLNVRKRREVMDLTPDEFEVLQRFQEGATWPGGARSIRPEGEPIYRDRELGPVWIYRNGIKARFVTVEQITLLRMGTGYQKRYVVRYRTLFYPLSLIHI